MTTEAFTEAELASTLDKLARLSQTLDPGERAALNAIGALAIDGATAAERAAGDPADEPDVEGFMIITGGRNGPGQGGSGGGGGSTGSGGVPWATPTPGGPVPVPYPNIGGILGSKFPF